MPQGGTGIYQEDRHWVSGYGKADGAVPVPGQVLDRLVLPSWLPSLFPQAPSPGAAPRSWTSSLWSSLGESWDWPLTSAWQAFRRGLRPLQPGHLGWLTQALPPCLPGWPVPHPALLTPCGHFFLSSFDVHDDLITPQGASIGLNPSGHRGMTLLPQCLLAPGTLPPPRKQMLYILMNTLVSLP